MSTFVSFHAHPDDESISTGGTMAKAAGAGHDVVLVVATRGELGEPQAGVLNEGEPLWQRRVEETHRSGEILGAGRVEFLGYEDSGMMGEATNANPACFWQADLDEAADRLAAILSSVGADILTVYDEHGGYGHPDHIQVHRVGLMAAQRAGVSRVFEATMNRTRLQALMEERGGELDMADEDRPHIDDDSDFGSPEELITHAVDVVDFLGEKRRSMEAHRSQIGPETFFLKLPSEAFAAAFGTEWFIAHDATRAPDEPFATDLFGSGD